MANNYIIEIDLHIILRWKTEMIVDPVKNVRINFCRKI